jgi:hypothetical protein
MEVVTELCNIWLANTSKNGPQAKSTNSAIIDAFIDLVCSKSK